MASMMHREQFEAYRFNLLMVGLVIALALAAQLALPLLSPYFTYIDLPLLVTIYFAMARRSPVTGMVTGCGLGLIQDALTHLPIGAYGIAKTVIGYVASSLGARIDVEAPLARAMLIFVFYLMHQIIFGLILRGMVGMQYPFRLQTIGAALLNAVVGAILFAFLDRFRRRIF